MIFGRKYSSVLIVTLCVLVGMNCVLGMQNPVGELKNEQDKKNSETKLLQKRLNDAWLSLFKDYFSPFDAKNYEKTKKEEFNEDKEKLAQTEEAPVQLAAVFDVDDTVLDKANAEKFIHIPNGRGGYYELENCKAVPLMSEFIKKLQKEGVTIFFATLRLKKSSDLCDNNDVQELTEKNLQEVGFWDFKKIYCMSLADRSKWAEQKTTEEYHNFEAQWKEQQREKIVKKGYKIILTAEDRLYNLQGANLGYPLLIPSIKKKKKEGGGELQN